MSQTKEVFPTKSPAGSVNLTVPSVQLTNLKDLIIKRSSVKGRITKYRNYLNKTIQIQSVTAADLGALTQRYDKFRDLSFSFDDLQSQIELLNSSELDIELDIREEFECEFSMLISQTQIFLDQNKPNNNGCKSPTNSLKSACSHECNHNKDSISFKLPIIKISNFDGTGFKWLEFRDTFTSLIHDNERIQSIHKFHYLNSYLEGDAARVICNLEISAKNYAEAWRLLCERYNNEKQLITNHLNSLIDLQPVPRDSAKDLRFLIDHVSKNLRALSTLGESTEHWDTLIVHLASAKLDNSTTFKWEEHKNSLEKSPTLKDFFQFIRARADILESVRHNKPENRQVTYRQPNHSFRNERLHAKSFAISADAGSSAGSYTPVCALCKGSHRLYDCASFLAKPVDQRASEVTRLRLCVNCLRKGHSSPQCRLGPCSKCKSRHNTLLCPAPSQTANKANIHTLITTDYNTSQAYQDNLVGMTATNNTSILLSTAIVDLYNPNTDNHITVRALLDSGSQCSILTDKVKSTLELTSQPTQVNIMGIGNTHSSNSVQRCVVKLKSRASPFESNLSCLVVPQITGNLPNRSIDISTLKLPPNIKLADNSFNQSSPVDLLIGADLFWDLIEPEQINLGHSQPIMRKSRLGWILAGPLYTTHATQNKSIICNHATIKSSRDEIISNDELNDNLQRFWEIEQIPELNDIQTEEEILCEAHFMKHTYRDDEGRFSVQLPLRTEPDCLGDSMKRAKQQFIALERRFVKNPELKRLYSNFIKEYADLGHLTEVPTVPQPSYFIPHHAVWKPNSESTRLRVVFNGSQKTTSGYSINDLQMIGPHIQDHLFNILLRFRQYTYVLSGDCEKMYRMVNVQDIHKNLQMILWRENVTDTLRLLRLNTVSYGYASSTFLSTRCLWQLGQECTDPRIKEIIQRDFLVDDLLTGSDNISDLKQIKHAVESALSAGCFNLRKYRSNSPCILTDTCNPQHNLTISSATHTLGVGWNPNEDYINFPSCYNTNIKTPTKRSILSDSCKIFDPLGLLSVLTVIPRILIQKLWINKSPWDAPIPNQLCKQWYNFVDKLKHLRTLHIPRHVMCEASVHTELHIFCDASKFALASAVYVKSENAQGDITVRLLCAKARVAPVKPTTIPRLELCACLLGAQLAAAVCRALRCIIKRKVFWTDSSIVLSWLAMRYDKLKTFVANRVGAILELTSYSQWRHVPTKFNSADLATRSVEADKIENCELWWEGPPFLRQPESEWPPTNTHDDTDIYNLPEVKVNITTHDEATKQTLIEFERYSQLHFLQRTFAYLLRFIHHCRHPAKKYTGSLQPDELKKSFQELVKLSQGESFPKELSILKSNKTLSPRSHILSLTPLLDNDVIRVGGRLENSCYPYEKRHPMLLHSKHALTKLLFRQEHLRLLHAGPQLLLCSIRETVWPIAGRDLARTTARQCVVCRRVSGTTPAPIMGMLPEHRVNPGFTFEFCSLDFAGPYYITDRKGRGCKITKCYLGIYCCLKYKALHMEAVSELSKNAFLLSLRRFISRRGKPTEIFCDNGRNMVAASRELSEFMKSHSDDIINYASGQGIKFVTAPPFSPHFSGLIESCVRSAKFHMKRIVGNTHLTFEELATLFSQIEAILNSRPLCPLSSSPDDFCPLTPGHFIIGRPLVSLPGPDLHDKPATHLDRFQKLEQFRQVFWKRWQTEYITELQQRHKWRVPSKSMNVGDLVLIKEPNTPPMHWRLGRITALIHGKDNVARVADVRTPKATYRRGIRYLCPLLDSAEGNILEPDGSNAAQHVRAHC